MQTAFASSNHQYSRPLGSGRCRVIVAEPIGPAHPAPAKTSVDNGHRHPPRFGDGQPRTCKHEARTYEVKKTHQPPLFLTVVTYAPSASKSPIEIGCQVTRGNFWAQAGIILTGSKCQILTT